MAISRHTSHAEAKDINVVEPEKHRVPVMYGGLTPR